MAPVNAICQMFHISTFTTLVMRVSSMTTLTAMATGMAINPMADAHAIGEVPGQPISTTLSPKLKFFAIASAALPRLSVKSEMTKLIPTKPIPIEIPARSDLPMPWRKEMPSMKMMIGIMTLGPKSTMYWMTCMVLPPKS